MTVTVEHSSNRKFLIVDDDYDDSSLFSEALSSIEPEVVCYCANDGFEALEKLNTLQFDNPDIIFLDLNMPGMSGWECLEKLKSMERFKDIPLIIHTTSSRRADRDLALEKGAICFVTKSYDFKKTTQMLKIVLEKLKIQDLDSICETVYKQLHLN